MPGDKSTGHIRNTGTHGGSLNTRVAKLDWADSPVLLVDEDLIEGPVVIGGSWFMSAL